jgi:mRNA-degrading endonuclease RelE of RelBE toxin-antitoxin system
MNFEITVTSRFEKHLKALAKRHKSIKDDYKHFIESLKENPFQGDELSPGIRKIRMAITSKGRGKSGGARVITYTILPQKEVEKFIFLKFMISLIIPQLTYLL